MTFNFSLQFYVIHHPFKRKQTTKFIPISKLCFLLNWKRLTNLHFFCKIFMQSINICKLPFVNENYLLLIDFLIFFLWLETLNSNTPISEDYTWSTWRIIHKIFSNFKNNNKNLYLAFSFAIRKKCSWT